MAEAHANAMCTHKTHSDTVQSDIPTTNFDVVADNGRAVAREPMIATPPPVVVMHRPVMHSLARIPIHVRRQSQMDGVGHLYVRRLPRLVGGALR